jgi:mono/diheme cytochrome c family protein
MTPSEQSGREGLGPVLTTAVLGVAVFLFLLFYAAREPERLRRIAEEEDVARKERLAALIPIAELNFMAHCAECHGFEGEGTALAGPPLRSKSFLDAVSDDALAEVITNGRPGTQMKPFAKDQGGPLSSEDIEGLVAFIRTWQENAPGGNADPRRQDPHEGHTH